MQADHVQQQDSSFPKGHFVEHRSKITLPKQLQVSKRVLAYKTYNNTYLLENESSYVNHNLYHITSKGEIIKKLEGVNYQRSSLYLISEYQVILQIHSFNENCIKQWDFRANQLLQFKIKKQLGEQADIWTTLFEQTQMLCIVQQVKIEQKTKPMPILIKFYRYPLQQANPIPIHIIKPVHQINSQYYPEKLNSHSGIIWKYRTSMYQPLNASRFFIFDLRHQQQQIQCFRFDHFFNINKDFDSYVGDIWEPMYGRICFLGSVRVGDRTRNAYKFKQKQLQKMLKKQKSIYYIWDYRTEKFTLLNIPSQNKLQFTNRFNKINRILLAKSFQQNISNSKSFKPMAFMCKQVGVSYVDSNNFKIMFTEKPSSKIYPQGRLSQIQWGYPTYCPTTYFQTRYLYKQNKQELQFIVRKYKPIPHNIPIISTFFINQIVSDPDEDLLLFVVGMLGVEENEQGWVNWDGLEKDKKEYMYKEMARDIQEEKVQQITLQSNIKFQDKTADHVHEFS